MGFFSSSKSERKPIERRESLRGVPVVNPNVDVERQDGGMLRVTVHVARGHGFLDRFRPPVMHRYTKLDELGTFVLEQIDGKRNTQAIIERFVKRFKANRREAELSVVAFLKMLGQRNIISIVIQ